MLTLIDFAKTENSVGNNSSQRENAIIWRSLKS